MRDEIGELGRVQIQGSIPAGNQQDRFVLTSLRVTAWKGFEAVMLLHCNRLGNR